MPSLQYRLHILQERIAAASARAGTSPSQITLVAVSKTWPVEAILDASNLGVRHFGENRVDEAADKIPTVNAQVQDITWHMVGHLQSRKVKSATALFDFIHSVDDYALAQRIDSRAAVLYRKIPVLLEVNISGERTKYGFVPTPREAFFDAVRSTLSLSHVDVQGLMTVAPIVERTEQARPFFRALRELRDELRKQFPESEWQHLSMGMSDDFEAAIAEGATILRIGRAIFGDRRQLEKG